MDFDAAAFAAFRASTRRASAAETRFESSIVPKNMTGAGGMVATNWLGQVAPSDGYTVGYMTGIVGGAMQEQPAIKIDARKLSFVAGAEIPKKYLVR